jgi:hypothetical protein
MQEEVGREGWKGREGRTEGGRRRYAGIGAQSNTQQRGWAFSGLLWRASVCLPVHEHTSCIHQRMHARTHTNEHTHTQPTHPHSLTHSLSHTHTCDRMPEEAISDDADSKSAICVYCISIYIISFLMYKLHPPACVRAGERKKQERKQRRGRRTPAGTC